MCRERKLERPAIKFHNYFINADKKTIFDTHSSEREGAFLNANCFDNNYEKMASPKSQVHSDNSKDETLSHCYSEKCFDH